jgi:membrane protein
VEPDERLGGVRNFIFKRALSLGLILGLGFFLLASLVINTLLSMSIEFVGDKLGTSGWLGIVANYVVSAVIITIIFGSIFKFMPDAKIRWRDVGIGALGTSLMFLLGRSGLQWYLSFADPSQQLGSAAGSLAAILIWIYYTASILLLGAEFTQAWSHRHGKKTVPEIGAIPTDP